MKKELEIETINKILDYLGRKPYLETAGIIQEIIVQTNKEVEKVKDDKEKK